MGIERTFSIIKPDATLANKTGAINALIEQSGLRIIAQRRIRMTKAQAQQFYAVHSERPFYDELVEFMMSGPVVVQVLEGENAIAKYREVMRLPIPQRQQRVQLENFTQRALVRTQFTVLMLQQPLQRKSRSFSLRTISSAE